MLSNNRNNLSTDLKNRYKERIQTLISLIKKDDFFIKIIVISVYLLVQSLYILLDLLFNYNTTHIFLQIAVYQRIISAILFTTLSSYYMYIYNFDEVVLLLPKNKYLRILSNIDKYWCKCYSYIGIIMSVNNYVSYGYIDYIYAYILLMSIFKLCMCYMCNL